MENARVGQESPALSDKNDENKGSNPRLDEKECIMMYVLLRLQSLYSLKWAPKGLSLIVMLTPKTMKCSLNLSIGIIWHWVKLP